MTVEQAERAGREAFAAGKGNFPLANPHIMQEAKFARVGAIRPLMAAFNRGWTAANIEQEV